MPLPCSSVFLLKRHISIELKEVRPLPGRSNSSSSSSKPQHQQIKTTDGHFTMHFAALSSTLALASLAVALPVADPQLAARQSNSLDALFKAKGKKYFGNIADPGTLSQGSTQDILKSDFGAITPENSLKWDATEPSRGDFQFGNADQTASFASQNGKILRCHTLLWHSCVEPSVSFRRAGADIRIGSYPVGSSRSATGTR